MLEHAKLETAISLPKGVFLPYVGIPTHILYFTECHVGKTRETFWYYQVHNDGFSLDNHRRKIKENDLKRVDYINFKKYQKEEGIKSLDFESISLAEVAKNDYSLLCSKYIKNKYISTKHQFISIEELYTKNIISIKKGKTITKNTACEGLIPVIAGGKKSPYFHNVATHNGNVITISASGKAGYIWYHGNPIWASDCNVLFSLDENILLTKYLYYVLHCQQERLYALQKGTCQQHVHIDDIKTLSIPLWCFIFFLHTLKDKLPNIMTVKYHYLKSRDNYQNYSPCKPQYLEVKHAIVLLFFKIQSKSIKNKPPVQTKHLLASWSLFLKTVCPNT